MFIKSRDRPEAGARRTPTTGRWSLAAGALALLACSGGDGGTSEDASGSTASASSPTTTAGSDATDATDATGASTTNATTGAMTTQGPGTADASTGSSGTGAASSSSGGFTGFGISMTLVEDDQGAFIEWSEMGGNYVQCTSGGEGLDLRFGESVEQDGAAGRYLDIRLCGDPGEGTLFPLDPEQPCGGQTGFMLWWHGDSGVYDNDPPAGMDCVLTLDSVDPLLVGEIYCLTLHDDMDRTTTIVESALVCAPT